MYRLKISQNKACFVFVLLSLSPIAVIAGAATKTKIAAQKTQKTPSLQDFAEKKGKLFAM